jgi:hypothetical protein
MPLRINARSAGDLHPLDAYMTPKEAVRALMAVERLPKSIADPCCGDGGLLETLRAGGHVVYGSDIADYGWPHAKIRDYLAGPIAMGDTAIVTNPPYRLAEEFIRKAISDGARRHAWLLRTNFLESVGRLPLWREHPPARIWISSRRLPMIHRHGWNGPKSSSNVAYAWYIWDAASNDRCKVDWFDWKEAALAA